MLARGLSPRTITSPRRTATTLFTITRLGSPGSLNATTSPVLTGPVRTTNRRSPARKAGVMLAPATTTRRGLNNLNERTPPRAAPPRITANRNAADLQGARLGRITGVSHWVW
jgi:hypothetical protein